MGRTVILFYTCIQFSFISMQLLPVNDNNNRPSEGENYPITPADSFDSLDDIEGKGNIMRFLKFIIIQTEVHM